MLIESEWNVIKLNISLVLYILNLIKITSRHQCNSKQINYQTRCRRCGCNLGCGRRKDLQGKNIGTWFIGVVVQKKQLIDSIVGGRDLVLSHQWDNGFPSLCLSFLIFPSSYVGWLLQPKRIELNCKNKNHSMKHENIWVVIYTPFCNYVKIDNTNSQKQGWVQRSLLLIQRDVQLGDRSPSLL